MKKVRRPRESAVFDLILHMSHNASFDYFEALVKEYNKFRLLLRVAFDIA